MLEVTAGDTTALMQNAFQIYSFSQLDKQALILLVTGGIITSISSTMFSTLTKKSMVSLSLGAACFLLPILFSGSIPIESVESLFPSIFLKFDGIRQLLQTSWIMLDHMVVHRIPFILCFWSIGIGIMILTIHVAHVYGGFNILRKRGLS